ncbi:DUF6612 family protein [Paenibacillus sp. OSY-SE]|uniref:DUF6612 family protein n=1 Tax=Paenibacillus sp. OSY-SE TaxID=1196323 RepID=UPI0002F488EE|nr:DUF6612 family protein [Paenibacillus sp. OSY-SE]
MMDEMNIQRIKISQRVNKETYLPTTSDVNMTMIMEQGDQTAFVDVVMSAAFSRHNEVGEIKVPQEVLDSAK